MSKISVATCEVPLDRLSSAQLELKPLSPKKLERVRLCRFGGIQKSKYKRKTLAKKFKPPASW